MLSSSPPCWSMSYSNQEKSICISSICFLCVSSHIDMFDIIKLIVKINLMQPSQYRTILCLYSEWEFTHFVQLTPFLLTTGSLVVYHYQRKPLPKTTFGGTRWSLVLKCWEVRNLAFHRKKNTMQHHFNWSQHSGINSCDISHAFDMLPLLLYIWNRFSVSCVV